MLHKHAAVRTLIAWFTLFLAWSALVLWFQGMALMQFIMRHSNLFAYDFALHSTAHLFPAGVPLMLLTFLVLTAGAMMASVTVMVVSLIDAVLSGAARRHSDRLSRAV